MSQMIRVGRELIRISPKDPKKIEYSTTEGRMWGVRGSSSAFGGGDFIDLTEDGNAILAQTSRGLYRSSDGGRTWVLVHP